MEEKSILHAITKSNMKRNVGSCESRASVACLFVVLTLHLAAFMGEASVVCLSEIRSYNLRLCCCGHLLGTLGSQWSQLSTLPYPSLSPVFVAGLLVLAPCSRLWASAGPLYVSVMSLSWRATYLEDTDPCFPLSTSPVAVSLVFCSMEGLLTPP